ncbi:helix-turn-helix transcriptional regulator [Halorarum halophilum]
MAKATPFKATSVARAEDRAKPEESTRNQPGPAYDVGSLEYDPSEIRSQKDFLLKLGIPHYDLFCQLISENGGTLPQKGFATYANLSSSTISRLLQEMEDDGQVVRVRVGREKVVCLPEYAPETQFFATDDSDETLRV